ncbi:MAG: HAD family hydrolase [Acidimicrobiia bacterium]|nr:HAD family hydrolase [Acidimicrobiia bacterium]MDH4309909.1 HAD family hydrolase [Acidimicrobiia bacterium]
MTPFGSLGAQQSGVRDPFVGDWRQPGARCNTALDMLVRAGTIYFDVDAVLLDKDGTLIDLVATWSPAGRRFIEVASGGRADLAARLGEAIGVSNGKVVPDGVLAAGTMEELARTALRVLRMSDAPDPREAVARAVEASSRTAVACAAPIGDVQAAIDRLERCGIALAVVTNDDTEPSITTLQALGIGHLPVVGADLGYSPKPEPETMLAACALLGADPARTVYVGDSAIDETAARSAGLLGAIGVGSSSIPFDATIGALDELVVDAE